MNVIARGLSAVRKATENEIAAFLDEMQEAGLRIVRAALVTSSDRDPFTIGNPHVQAHAAEGALYRDSVKAALEQRGLRVVTLVDRDIDQLASSSLGQRQRSFEKRVHEMGRTVGPPWRRFEKRAALAAWVALASGKGRPSPRSSRSGGVTHGRGTKEAV